MSKVAKIKAKQKIFFVDDEPLICREISEVLENAGLGSSCFNNAGECLQQLYSLRCNLLITDYKLPEMNGIELMKKAKQFLPQLPVIIITGYGNIELAISAMKEGAEDFLEKPLNTDMFLSKVKSIISQNTEINRLLLSSLTNMERKILTLISSGKNNKEIAHFLNRSRRTVENHRAHLMKKFSSHNVAELVNNASKSGVIELAWR